jgi:uracil-DNA glycosylase
MLERPIEGDPAHEELRPCADPAPVRRAPPEGVEALAAEIRACRLCAGRFAATATAHAPAPVVWLASAPLLIASQAPGARAHASAIPFDDPSGDRLRGWLGIDRATFYDRRRITIAPMAFCFPGYDARGGDLPPPPVCAATWRDRVLAAMPAVRLTLVVGGHALRWYGLRRPVTEVVRGWADVPGDVIPLPHPSWRNTGWMKRNPWFEAELLPVLRARVAALIAL